MAYTVVAEALTHMWNDLGSPQIMRIVEVYTRVMHNQCLTIGTHTGALKVLSSLVDVLPTKMQVAEVTKVLTAIFETTADRMEAGTVIYGEALSRFDNSIKSGEAPIDIYQIEKSRPVQGSTYATEKPEMIIQREYGSLSDSTCLSYHEQNAESFSCKPSVLK
jgi:hypothetical protein